MSGTNDDHQIDTRKEILVRQIGAKIAYYRTLRDLTQKELANIMTISRYRY